MKMTIRVLVYTLEVICHGNRSECARRLDMDYVQFKKMYNHVMAGKESFTMPESLMQMYEKEGLDFNLALKHGKEGEDGAEGVSADMRCSELVGVAKSILEYGSRKAKNTAAILSAANSLLNAIEKGHCGHACDKGRYAENMDSCPISRLIDFISWMQEEMSES